MFGGRQAWGSRPARACSAWLAALASIGLLAGCSGNLPDLASSPGTPQQPTTNIGEGKVKAGLILPLSASGNATVAAQSMRNAAEMALAEFNNPDLQLLVARSRQRNRPSTKGRRSSWARCLRSPSVRSDVQHAPAACR
jgi:hypothetical protein